MRGKGSVLGFQCVYFSFDNNYSFEMLMVVIADGICYHFYNIDKQN